MRSLASRLLLILSAWLLVALVVTGVLLSALFRQNAENNFQGLLLAHAYNLMGAVERSSSGDLSGSPDLGDPRFLTPASGWYWAVVEAKNPRRPLLHSLSITGETLDVTANSVVPFGDNFRRSYSIREGQDLPVQRLEAQLYFGEGGPLYQVIVAGNRLDVEEAISAFNRRLAWFFSAFALGTLIAVHFAVRFGLRPLKQAVGALVDVREGRTDKLEGVFPVEIEPLAHEINALIDANRSVTERARTQVGNLAHALKTPLAVILNEVRKPAKSTPKLVEEQANLMKSQIGTYLDRARIAAQRQTISSRTSVLPVAEKLLRVMGKLSPDIKFDLSNQAGFDPQFQGEEQDLEEVLGNLLENASRFARSTVRLTLRTQDGEGRTRVALLIEDDGPGLTPREMELALQRGKRLDETKPGSGLGLSIVRDIADEYGGYLELQKSELGGLRAAVFLPRIAVE